eukprot:Em0011g825a
MNKKTKRVGNANLYIGLAYHKRKSYPRDSHGFEPLDEYFNNDVGVFPVLGKVDHGPSRVGGIGDAGLTIQHMASSTGCWVGGIGDAGLTIQHMASSTGCWVGGIGDAGLTIQHMASSTGCWVGGIGDAGLTIQHMASSTGCWVGGIGDAGLTIQHMASSTGCWVGGIGDAGLTIQHMASSTGCWVGGIGDAGLTIQHMASSTGCWVGGIGDAGLIIQHMASSTGCWVGGIRGAGLTIQHMASSTGCWVGGIGDAGLTIQHMASSTGCWVGGIGDAGLTIQHMASSTGCWVGGIGDAGLTIQHMASSTGCWVGGIGDAGLTIQHMASSTGCNASERDTTSPETDIEELIRQERAKKKAAEKEKEVAKKKAQEEEEKAKGGALQQQDATRVKLTYPAPVQRPYIILDSSDSDSDGAEHLELFRKLAGLATARNNKAPPTSHVPVATAVPVMASAPSLAGTILAAQGGAKTSVEGSERESDKHSSERSHQSQPDGPRVVISRAEGRELRRSQEPPSIRQRKSVGTRAVAEERSNPEPEQGRPKGRLPRRAPGDESDEGNKQDCESSHRSQREEANEDAAGAVSEAATTDVSKEIASKRLRVRKSLVGVGEEESNPEPEQGKRRGRPPKKAVESAPDEVDKHNAERSQWEETNGDAAGTLSEGTALEDSHEVANKWLRPKKSLVDVVEEQNPELEQVRSRGRPPRTAPGDESDEGNKRNLESSHRSRHEETNGDAAGTLSEGTALEDSHEVANKLLRPKKSLVDVVEEQNPELEQVRSRGRPPRTAPGDESDEGNKRNLESSHRSRHEETNGDAAGTLSEGTELEGSHEVASKRLRVRKSMVGVGEEESNPEPEQGKRRGRPPKKAVESAPDEVDKHNPERSQWEETNGDAAGTLSEGTASHEVANKRLRVRKSMVGVGEEESNPEPEQGKRRGRPPKKAVESAPDEVDKHNPERSQWEETNGDAAGTLSEGTALEDSHEVANKWLRPKKSLVDVVEEQNPELEQVRSRGRPSRKVPGVESDEGNKRNSESSHRSQHEETNGDAAGTLSEGTALEDSHEVANKWLRPKKSLVDVGEEQNPEPEQGRPRGRAPRKAPGDEPVEGNKQNSESSHRSRHEETNGDAAGTLSEGTASHEVANKRLRPKRSLVDVVEEQNPELEQGRSRGRPPRKAPGDEPVEGNKRNLESSHRSRHEETNGDAAGTLSEGTASHEVANKRLRPKRSLVDVGEEQNPELEQGRSRGRPPRKAPGDESDEGNKRNSETSHRSQQKEVKGANETVSQGRASIPSAVVDDESREYTAMSSRTYTLPLKPSSSPKKSNKKQLESSKVNRKNVSQHQETLEKRQTRRSAPSDMSFVPQDASTLERRLRSMAKEREEEEEDESEEEDELEEENVMDTQEEEDQSEAEDVQGNMATEEGQGNELGDSDEGASGNEQEGTIVRRLFRSPRESSKSLEKSRKLSELPSGSEHSGTKDSAPTKAPSAPPSARKRKKRWSVVPPALKRTKKAIPSALERLKKAAGVEVDNTVLLNVTDIGGKKYHRVPIKPKEDFTPAVRRSHRTRLPRLEPDEIVDYDQWFNPITLTGPSVVSVLVPAERTPKPRRKNATSNQEVTDDDYPPVPIHDDAGNVVDEQSIIFTPASAEKVNSVGQPVEESPDGVRITKYFAGDNTSNGLITLDGLAEKSKSKASRYDLFFCVMKGKVLVTVNSVQYTLLRHFGIRIPQGALYSVQNLSPSVAELYYYISKVVPINTTESVSE